MKPRVLTTLLVCTAILTTTVTPAMAAVMPVGAQSGQTAMPATATNTLPKAMADLSVQGKQLVDQNNAKWTAVGQPSMTTDAEFDQPVLNFNGSSAFYTTYTNDQLAQLKNGMAIEAYFKYDPAADASGEHEIFSSQQGGGVGLGVQGNQVTFYAHDGSGYKTPKGSLRKGHWVHAVGVIDKNKSASLYLDGQLAQQVVMPGDLKLAQGTNDFVLGGDAMPGGSHVQSMMTGKVKLARLYDHTLTDAQVGQLNQAAQVGKKAEVPVDQTVATKLVGPKQVTSGHTYGFNVHARQLKTGDADSLSMDVVYDASKFDFVGADRLLQGDKTSVQQIQPGRVRITTSASLSSAEFKQYSQTRLAHVNLKAKSAGDTSVQFEQVTKETTLQLGGPLAVNIQGKDAMDVNGDGIVGVGDVAMAPTTAKEAIAQKTEIKPYKHVIVLTTDGGGDPWDPNGIYYAEGTATPAWTTDPAIMKKRRNTYTMDLFNNKFAMSTSAKAVSPSISAQNYISMLHGRPWDTLPADYQGTNGTMGQQYFEDFDKAQPLFPSVFKILQKANPNRGAAAFSEWGPIVNSIIEPDAPVTTKQSAKLKSFDDVADYVGTPEFQNTAMVYMQSDYMDGQGHSKGWYNDNYWDQYAQYDGLFKKVMDKLESTGHSHDTLVIANADHGGSGTNHGGWDARNRSIFMALGGETVDSGRRLHGGSNSDITALVLNALQVPQTPEMVDSNVFDSTAFLKQTDLTKKRRDVETLKLSRNDNQAKIQLTNLKTRQLTAVDMQLDLAGRDIDTVKAAAGVQVLRQTVENGKLRLIVSADKPTSELVTVNFKPAKTRAEKTVSIEQAMAGTSDGTEVLVDLDNDNPLTATKPDEGGTSVIKPGDNHNGDVKPNGDGSGSKPDENGSSIVKPGDNSTDKKPGSNGSSMGKPNGNGTTTKPDSNGAATVKPNGNGSDTKPDKNGSSVGKTNDKNTTSGAASHATTTGDIADDNTGKTVGTDLNDSSLASSQSTSSLSETKATPTNHHTERNTSASWLPQTGEQVHQWLAVAGSVLLVALGSVAVWLRKRRRS